MAADAFRLPAPLPIAREAEILTILIDEAADVIQRATKLLRFGRHEIQPGQPLTNHQRLSEEIGQLQHMIEEAAYLGLLDADSIANGGAEKAATLPRYLQSAEP